MKILLIGEYSGVHTNLAKALKNKKIELTTVSDGDAYKKFPADIFIKYDRKELKNRHLNYILKFYYLILIYTGLLGVFQILKYVENIKSLKNYDVVQVINPIALSGFGSIVNLFFMKFIIKNNKKVFLCCLGDDYVWVKGSIKNKKFKSMFYLMSLKNFEQYVPSFKYTHGFLYKKLNFLLINESKNLIPGLYDYYHHYKDFEKCTEIHPVPIEVDNNILALKFTKYPINIFHGWQPNKEYRKGNFIFDEAVRKLLKKYPDKVVYNVVGGLPYEEYIKTFNDAHIFLDQCMSMDQGVNALVAMSKGKVVFSGLCDQLKDYYNLSENELPVVNSLPDVDYLYQKLEDFIINPNKLEIYSFNAIEFIKNKHNMEKVADMYLNVWSK